MKNLSILTRLQTQYNKLTQLLQTKGNHFSQFKYQQILNRISRCGLQMKRLGMGMGVCLALGVGSPVMGQTPDFIQHYGSSNPFHNLPSTISSSDADNQVNFVDIDGDGDYDFFATAGPYSYATLKFYENIGTATSPSFILQTNPIPITDNVYVPDFADIDNDGDLDAFSTRMFLQSGLTTVIYFENQGTATAPNFVNMTGASNPLDTINTIYPAIDHGYLWSDDLDNDGDIDFWYKHCCIANTVKYCENQGTPTNPHYVVRPSTADPLQFNNTTHHYQVVKLIDWDKDGDKDAFSRISIGGAQYDYAYYENTTTGSFPVFSTIPSTDKPLDSIPNVNGMEKFEFVDLDGDGDLDVAGINTSPTPSLKYYYYYENREIVLDVLEIDSEEIFSIFPNPSTGIVMFEKQITAYVSLYNVTGQKLWGKELYEEQQVNLTELNNGIYFLTIETAKDRIRKKIIIQK